VGLIMQWFKCLLHFNELPYRYLFQNLDGETIEPSCFSGKIIKQFVYCENLLVANFETIDGEHINATKTDLSKDQQYLLDIYKAVKIGECTLDLAIKDPGLLNHSRWLKCANRLLRRYVSEINPSCELRILTNYIMKMYAPIWFNIKRNHLVKYGPIHLYKHIQTTRQFPDNLRQIIDSVIQRNVFLTLQKYVISNGSR